MEDNLETKNEEQKDLEENSNDEDLQIRLNASEEVIKDLKASNEKYANDIKALKTQLAKISLQVGIDKKVDDGEIFGAFNKYNKK